MSYNSALLLLDVDPDKTVIQKETCTCMLLIALFTISKAWKLPKYTLAEEWTKKMWHIYTQGILLSHKKEWNNSICSNIDGPRDYYTRWSKPDMGRQMSYNIAYMWNLKKKNTKELIHKTERDSQT